MTCDFDRCRYWWDGKCATPEKYYSCPVVKDKREVAILNDKVKTLNENIDKLYAFIGRMTE